MISGENPPDDSLVSESLKQEIERTLSSLLTEKEATIIRLYYGLGNKHAFIMREIARINNLSM